MIYLRLGYILTYIALVYVAVIGSIPLVVTMYTSMWWCHIYYKLATENVEIYEYINTFNEIQFEEFIMSNLPAINEVLMRYRDPECKITQFDIPKSFMDMEVVYTREDNKEDNKKGK